MKLDNVFKFCVINTIGLLILVASNIISSNFALMCSCAWMLFILLFYIFGYILHHSKIGSKEKSEKLNPGGYVTRLFTENREKFIAELHMDIESHDNVMEHIRNKGFTGTLLINNGSGVINLSRIAAIVDVEIPTNEELEAYRARSAHKVEK